MAMKKLTQDMYMYKKRTVCQNKSNFHLMIRNIMIENDNECTDANHAVLNQNQCHRYNYLCN